MCCVEDSLEFDSDKDYHGYVVAFKMQVKVKHVVFALFIACIPLLNIICSVGFLGLMFYRFAIPPLARFGNQPLFK
jgi:hypothetical protein